MTNYLIRRAFQMVFVVIMATIAIYLMLNAVPGGPLSGLNLAADAKSRLSPQEIARIEATLGLNKPMYLAYLTWLFGEDWLDEVGDVVGNPDAKNNLFITGTWRDYQSPTCQNAGGTNANADPAKRVPCREGVLRWDWGESWALARGQTVTSIIGSRLTNTLILMTTVTVVSLVIAIPIGIISAVRQYSVLDYVATTFSFFGI
ncbi:MAG TPA: ABC transporter permease, partial [Chloroflexota bacterium]|nr:ABC transporter permease [Chloroflexota bacterium]